jgi:hypothetical protein
LSDKTQDVIWLVPGDHQIHPFGCLYQTIPDQLQTSLVVAVQLLLYGDMRGVRFLMKENKTLLIFLCVNQQ